MSDSEEELINSLVCNSPSQGWEAEGIGKEKEAKESLTKSGICELISELRASVCTNVLVATASSFVAGSSKGAVGPLRDRSSSSSGSLTP